MGGEVCYQKGRERGPWFEIKCIKEVIRNKKARSEDTSFERRLLENWSKYSGWGNARAIPCLSRKSSRRVTLIVGG